jgi:hypothetical protein
LRAEEDESARGRAVGFTMAMLQRRMASTVYAVRRTLERMRDRREKILADPEGYRREQLEARLPDDFDELTEEEQQEIVARLEDVVVSADPTRLREEIARLTQLIDQACSLERREVESKLKKLRSVLKDQGFLSDREKKLLIFTEHKDSLDFLAGNGRENRPLGKLREWGLTVTQIHGGMKIGSICLAAASMRSASFGRTPRYLWQRRLREKVSTSNSALRGSIMTFRGIRYGSSNGSAAFTDTAKSTTASFSISSRRIPVRDAFSRNSSIG